MFIAYTALTSYWFNWSLRRSDSSLKWQLVGTFRLIRLLTCPAEVGFQANSSDLERETVGGARLLIHWDVQAQPPLNSPKRWYGECRKDSCDQWSHGCNGWQKGFRTRTTLGASPVSWARLQGDWENIASSDESWCQLWQSGGCVSIFGTNQHESVDSVTLYQRFKLLLAVW